MTVFGIEISGEHARFALVVFSSLIAALGFLAGRWSRHRSRVSFKSEDLVASTVVTELYGIRQREDGEYVLHIITQGSTEAIDRVFANADLVRHIQRGARHHPGLLQLNDPIAHRMMMDEGKDRITGLDPKANLDFMVGRPTRDDELLFGFAAYKEVNGDRANGLRDEVGRLVQMVISVSEVGSLADADFARRLNVQHAGYKPRALRLHDFAKEWLRLEGLPQSQRRGATDKIWHVTVRTAMT